MTPRWNVLHRENTKVTADTWTYTHGRMHTGMNEGPVWLRAVQAVYPSPGIEGHIERHCLAQWMCCFPTVCATSQNSPNKTSLSLVLLRMGGNNLILDLCLWVTCIWG